MKGTGQWHLWAGDSVALTLGNLSSTFPAALGEPCFNGRGIACSD